MLALQRPAANEDSEQSFNFGAINPQFLKILLVGGMQSTGPQIKGQRARAGEPSTRWPTENEATIVVLTIRSRKLAYYTQFRTSIQFHFV